MTDTVEIETDVLIVGGGLAGLRAAIAAREEGADVTMVVKGKLGRSGSSAISTAGYAAVLPEMETGDDVEAHVQDTLRGGAFMADPELVRILCSEAAAELRSLEHLGCQILREDAGYRLFPSGEHRYPRVVVPVNRIGTDLTLPLAARAGELCVRVLESTMALELLLHGQRVAGAVCLDSSRDALLAISAPATVLATGGCGQLFPISSNPRDVTGDGLALALRAGAELRDMEFIQFYPWRCIDPFDLSRMPVQPSTFTLGARLYNSRGERFMQGYNPQGFEASTRDVAARAIFDQIRNGLGVRGGVRLDLSDLTEEEMERSNPKLLRGLRVKGIDYRTYEFIVAPEAHYFMGGVRIDEQGRSSVPGLFTAGEVAGGIQGANRLNSNALPETLVFGRRAGEAAARLAGSEPLPALPGPAGRRWQQNLSEQAGGEPGADRDALHALRRELQQAMALSLGIVRSQARMENGLEQVRALRSRLERLRLSTPAKVRDWMELQFLCDVGEVCLAAALLRTESRGAHYREDYPMADDAAWRRPIVLRRNQASQRIEEV